MFETIMASIQILLLAVIIWVQLSLRSLMKKTQRAEEESYKRYCDCSDGDDES